MARYRKIDPRIWSDEKFISLTPEEKLIAIYVITAQSNRIGCFVFSPGKAAEETLGVTLGVTFAKRFGNVCRTLNWRWDPTHRILLIPSWWKYNPPENANVLRGCLKDLDELPNCALVQEFLTYTQTLGVTLGVTLPERIPKRYPIQEQEQEQEQEQDPDLADSGSAGRGDEDFETWYLAYPRHEKREVAKSAWRKLGATRPPLEQLLAAIAWQKQSGCLQARVGQDGRSVIPHPSSYLNARRWEDEKEPGAKQATPSAAAYCEFHQWARNRNKRGANHVAWCPECKHAAALHGDRRAEPTPIGIAATGGSNA